MRALSASGIASLWALSPGRRCAGALRVRVGRAEPSRPAPLRAFGEPLVLSQAGGRGRGCSAMRQSIAERLCENPFAGVIISATSSRIGAEGDDMISIIAKLTVVPGKEDELKQLGTEMVAAVKANEPGTLQYAFSQSQSAPTEFYFIERYADDAAMSAHRENLKAFGSRFAGVLAGRPEITRLDVVAE
jgi:quinol monooxygenase YgiN